VGITRQAFEFPTTLVSCLWFVVGPILLLVGFIARAVARDGPRGTGVVHAAHVLIWAWSSFVGFVFVASI
jgi:hypothetical protein